jgi:hypothetical protein
MMGVIMTIRKLKSQLEQVEKALAGAVLWGLFRRGRGCGMMLVFSW